LRIAKLSRQDSAGQHLAERPGAAGDQNPLFI